MENAHINLIGVAIGWIGIGIQVWYFIRMYRGRKVAEELNTERIARYFAPWFSAQQNAHASAERLRERLLQIPGYLVRMKDMADGLWVYLLKQGPFRIPLPTRAPRLMKIQYQRDDSSATTKIRCLFYRSRYFCTAWALAFLIMAVGFGLASKDFFRAQGMPDMTFIAVGFFVVLIPIQLLFNNLAGRFIYSLGFRRVVADLERP
jgi:hypothetical protein